jgi:hypothetical protein
MSLIQLLFGSRLKKGRGRPSARAPWRPNLEHLETRTVPSTMGGHGAHVGSGQLATLKTLVHQVEKDVHAIKDQKGATAGLEKAYHQVAKDIRKHQSLTAAVTNLENRLATLQTNLGTTHPKLSADIAALDTFLHQLASAQTGHAG